jgi:hypothetical protein
MEKNSNYITVEVVCKISMQDYRIVLGIKRMWIVAIVVGVIQLVAWALKGQHL